MSPSSPAFDRSALAVVWLRDDLRLDDNPALADAVASGRPVLVVHVDDTTSPGLRPLGGAARWWQERSLAALSADLAARGGRLDRLAGGAADVVPQLLASTGAAELHFARRLGSAETAIDRAVIAAARRIGVAVAVHPGNLLHDPATLVTGAGTGFRVFTPFWRALRAGPPPAAPIPAPARIPAAPPPTGVDAARSAAAPHWAGGLAAAWTPGEAGARARLDALLDRRLAGYADERDRPDRDVGSRLSPHLRFGEISIRRIHTELTAVSHGPDAPAPADLDKYLAELGWREFSHHLLAHRPDLATANLQPAFDAFPWRDDPAFAEAWRRGATGYPLVDAGMRELWTTGTMHNRVRMVAASFLIKHGLIDWRIGEAWFWDTLVDACPAANPASWQWVAGCGADAAPFFRIFNPVLQGEKFDPEGNYVRRYVPELAGLPNRRIHAPWTAAPLECRAAGLRLGVDRPLPIVDHAAARDRALAAFARTRGDRPSTPPRRSA